MSIDDCTSREQRISVALAITINHGKIKEGDFYLYQRGLHDGRWVTWRARVDMNRVCEELGLYDLD